MRPAGHRNVPRQSGPGAIHLLNGLYDAKMDHTPLVAIVGQSSRQAMGGSYQQEVDLVSLFKDVAGEYIQQASHPAQIRHLVDRAVRIAKAERTVTCIIIPADLQEEKAIKQPEHLHGTAVKATPVFEKFSGSANQLGLYAEQRGPQK